MAYDVKATEQYIREAAAARGINPDIAVRVARSEGLANGVYQSNLSKGGSREPSYGPFQLLVGGQGTNYPAGMGNDFIARTGLDPRDPSTVPQQVDFALDNAAKNGWGAWYGAKKVGVDRFDGIGGQPSGRAPSTQIATAGGGDAMVYGGAQDDTLGVEPIAPPTNPGGLGGLGGFQGFVNNPEFGDTLQAIGLSLMSSPSNNPFAGVADNLANRQNLRARQEDRQLAREERQQDRRSTEVLLRSMGFGAEEARAYSNSPSVASAAISQRRQATEQAREDGERNTTRQWLIKNHPDLAEVPIDVAVRIAQERRSQSGKPPELVTIYNDQGQEQKAQWDPVKNDYVPVGSAKTMQRGSADDRRAMREAEDGVFAADQALSSVQTAQELSPQALEGAGARQRAWLANNLPDWLVPDVVASPQEAQATLRLDQATTEGALQQLKSIFGGAPTEGERQILLDIQGASTQPEAVRKEIYARAERAILRRRDFNAERAAELRGLTYGPGSPTPTVNTPAPEAVNPFRRKYGLE